MSCSPTNTTTTTTTTTLAPMATLAAVASPAIEATVLSWQETTSQVISNIILDHATVLLFFALFAAPVASLVLWFGEGPRAPPNSTQRGKSICSHLLLALSSGLISSRIGAFTPFLETLAFALAVTTALMRTYFPHRLADPYLAAISIAGLNTFTPWIWNIILRTLQIKARMSIWTLLLWTVLCIICTVMMLRVGDRLNHTATSAVAFIHRDTPRRLGDRSATRPRGPISPTWGPNDARQYHCTDTTEYLWMRIFAIIPETEPYSSSDAGTINVEARSTPPHCPKKTLLVALNSVIPTVETLADLRLWKQRLYWDSEYSLGHIYSAEDSLAVLRTFESNLFFEARTVLKAFQRVPMVSEPMATMTAFEATALSWAQTMAQVILNIIVDHARVLVFFALFAAPVAALMLWLDEGMAVTDPIQRRKSICSYLLLTLSFGLISARIGFDPFIQSLAFALAATTALYSHLGAASIACLNIFTPWIWDAILSIVQIEARMSVSAIIAWSAFCSFGAVFILVDKEQSNSRAPNSDQPASQTGRAHPPGYTEARS
ncbi:hypothetical protein B0H16DRAFT_1825166 [Mycena metata]|uniref:Uncharacterized protein n=1 Tax=Mycena metata TaxID=1033252 RepID=A0AAD7NE85_9AGAR|nr:hypothetical protein B0H16DRAFT_1825166 [Mycena metata]